MCTPISTSTPRNSGDKSALRVLGIDPGTQTVGYGFIEMLSGRCAAPEYGEIRVPKDQGFPQKLRHIHESILGLVDRLGPDAVSVEETYVTSNAKTTLRLGHARGVILLAAAQRGVTVAEYAPREIKLAVLGRGGAGKAQVQWMVCQILKLEPSGVSEDAADALAAALCHGFRCESPVSRIKNGT
jgi:crossover junction endodeoxyribonuclease RuvC